MLVGGWGSIDLYHSAWELPIMHVVWKIQPSHSCCVDSESMPLKMLFNLYFKIRALAPIQISASLSEGPIYLFLCWVITLLIKSSRWRAHYHLCVLLLVYIGYELTGSLLPWITMFSPSLIFKGALHLCFAVSERASEIPFCYIMLWLFWESVVIRILLLWIASWLCYWYE